VSTGPILVIEDEEVLAESIGRNLEREGLRVVAVTDGAKAMPALRSQRPALVILDLMLPGIPGLDLCRLIRQESTVPILILTARDREADRVAGLECGADDYVTKPFSMRELISRVRAQLRRAGMGAAREPEGLLMGGRVEMDIERHEVRVDGQSIDLPPKEFALLETLLRRRGRLVTREMLMAEVWGYTDLEDTRTLDVHIKRLRSKIEEDPTHPTLVKTVRGLGYKFDG
jgi:two-component system response regulator RegX3